jgi:hypothetical protein
MSTHVNLPDRTRAHDDGSVATLVAEAEQAMYRTHWLVEKWTPDQENWCRERLLKAGVEVVQNGLVHKHIEVPGLSLAHMQVVPNLIDIREGPVPSELLRLLLGDNPEDGFAEQEGNILLNAGIQKFEELLAGISTPTKWDNTNAQLGVGDSTTAESASQTDLQASTNKTWVGMNATYPSRSSQTLSWQADHTSSNYAWQEVACRNGASALNLLNRKVTSLGTKTTGTWTLTLTIAFS